MIIIYTLDFYRANGMEKIVIYNHRYLSSNQFYRKFGAQVARQEYQMGGRLLIDVFLADILLMKQNIEQSLKKYV